VNDWIELIKEAAEMGLTKEEIQSYLKSQAE
jgi:hypothetical protein